MGESPFAPTAAFLDSAIAKSGSNGLCEWTHTWDHAYLVGLPLGAAVLGSLKLANARSAEWASEFSEDTSELARDFWRLAQLCANARIRSRLADAAWRLDMSCVDAGREAVAAYVESIGEAGIRELQSLGPTGVLDGNGEPVVPDQEFPVYVSERLARAREISLARKDGDSVREIDRAVLDRIQRFGAQPDCRRAAWVLRAVASPPRAAPAWYLREALRVLGQLVGHPEQLSGFVESLVREAKAVARTTDSPDELIERLDCAEAEAWVTWANRNEGAQRWAQLHNAHRIAQDRGLSALRGSIAQLIAEIDTNDFMQPTRTEVPLSDDLLNAIDVWKQDLLEALPDLRSGIARLADVVVADIPKLAVENSELETDSLAAWFNTQTVGEGRTYVTEDEASKARHHLYGQVSQRSTFLAALLIAPVIDALRAAFGSDPDTWRSALRHDPLIDELAATRIAESFDLFFAGRFDASAHLAAPTGERVFRRIALAAGKIVPDPPRPGKDYEPPGLGAVLAELAGVIPEEYRLWFQHLYTDPMGHNLRNAIGHGTAGMIDREWAALLLIAPCFALHLAPRD